MPTWNVTVTGMLNIAAMRVVVVRLCKPDNGGGLGEGHEQFFVYFFWNISSTVFLRFCSGVGVAEGREQAPSTLYFVTCSDQRYMARKGFLLCSYTIGSDRLRTVQQQLTLINSYIELSYSVTHVSGMFGFANQSLQCVSFVLGGIIVITA